MFESIKSEKVLSLNNWRYRILHWAFGVNPKTVDEAVEMGVQRFFYTHFCPLFHFTNLVLLTFPFILAGKLVLGTIRSLGASYQKLPSRPRKATKHTINDEYRHLKEYMQFLTNTGKGIKYGDFYDDMVFGVTILSKEEALAFCKKFLEAQEANREARTKKKEASRQRIVFWVNFSQVFIKGFLNLFYLGLAGLVLWATWAFGLTVLSAIWNAPILPFLYIALKYTAYVAVAALALGVFYMTVGRKFLGFAFEAVGDGFAWVGNKLCDIVEFFSVFYAENCPPIKIVSDEEAIIEEGI